MFQCKNRLFCSYRTYLNYIDWSFSLNQIDEAFLTTRSWLTKLIFCSCPMELGGTEMKGFSSSMTLDMEGLDFGLVSPYQSFPQL